VECGGDVAERAHHPRFAPQEWPHAVGHRVAPREKRERSRRLSLERAAQELAQTVQGSIDQASWQGDSIFWRSKARLDAEMAGELAEVTERLVVLRERKREQARAAVLISPWVDLTASCPSCRAADALDYGQTWFLLQHRKSREADAGRDGSARRPNRPAPQAHARSRLQ